MKNGGNPRNPTYPDLTPHWGLLATVSMEPRRHSFAGVALVCQSARLGRLFDEDDGVELSSRQKASDHRFIHRMLSKDASRFQRSREASKQHPLLRPNLQPVGGRLVGRQGGSILRDG